MTNTAKTLNRAIQDAIDALPATADAIATHLTRLGCKGHVGESRRCPVARYLNKSVPALSTHGLEVMVSAVCAYLVWKPEVEDRTAVTLHDVTPIHVPLPVSQFIAQFDNYEYPMLILRDEA